MSSQPESAEFLKVVCIHITASEPAQHKVITVGPIITNENLGIAIVLILLWLVLILPPVCALKCCFETSSTFCFRNAFLPRFGRKRMLPRLPPLPVPLLTWLSLQNELVLLETDFQKVYGPPTNIMKLFRKLSWMIQCGQEISLLNTCDTLSPSAFYLSLYSAQITFLWAFGCYTAGNEFNKWLLSICFVLRHNAI